MKLGLIVESGPQGAEVQVLPYLAEQIAPGVECSCVTFCNKPALIGECGPATANLLNDGCDKVLIVWDLYPAWREDGCRPDCVEDCVAIRAALRTAGVSDDDGRVAMICIREELEAWLVADGRALSAVLSRPTHPVRVGDTRSPDTARNPKVKLRNIFRQHGRSDYSDRTHAIQIVQALPGHNRIGRSQSFQRFTCKVQAIGRAQP